MRRDLSRLLRLPRRLRMTYYAYWNRVKFRLCGIRFGKDMQVFDKIRVKIRPAAEVTVGDHFTFTSGANFNPLCKNIRGSIYASEESKITIGHDVGISSATLRAKLEIRFGNHVKIGGDCILLDTDAHNLDYAVHRLPSVDGKTAKSKPIVIEDDVLIGTRCIILKGVTIGARSVIGSGSVVTKSIPADCIAAGNPCRVIRKLGTDK